MRLLRFDETVFQANCYLLFPDEGSEALVIDPGAGAAEWVEQTCAQFGYRPGAVVLTHGHADHVWDASRVAGSNPVYLGASDWYRLNDPASMTAMPGMSGEQVERTCAEFSGHGWEKPANAQYLPDDVFTDAGAQVLEGLSIRALPAPGHTEGSTVFLVDGTLSDDDALLPDDIHPGNGSARRQMMFSGDVLFRLSVGRTDLHGGDGAQMAATIKLLSVALDSDTVVFPGHGSSTTIGFEREHSPFVRMAYEAGRIG
ncbi:MAG: MBL fold metallo-hydrolase [Actinomycetaceae bacterium]|nr:MBL fold metallo-hydrolase [Actinomycetaceae bacterium]MDY6083257.1 MBL fold metallo-hydrolase [Actinomycetaceae bacterium]